MEKKIGIVTYILNEEGVWIRQTPSEEDKAELTAKNNNQ